METKTKRRLESESTDPSQERPRKSVKADANAGQDDPPDTPLACLLDITHLTTHLDISSRFDQIADALFFDFELLLGCDNVHTKFQILELEFYLKKPGCHDDPFTHGSAEQSQSGRWYFHRAQRYGGQVDHASTSGGGYRGGSRKGLDLTFGGPVTSSYFTSLNKRPPIRGGILLRTIRRMKDSKVISGPSLLVDEILRLSGASGISELVEQKWGGDLTALPTASSTRTLPSTFLLLQRKTDSLAVQKPRVYRSPRIGLDLSHQSTTALVTDARVVYVSKRYRYFIHPDLLTSNGRGQTFLGVYQASRDSGRYGNEAGYRREVIKVTGLSEKTVVKYLEDYKSGNKDGNLKTFVGVAGKRVSASLSGWLKMMGTLDKLQAVDATE